MISYKTKALINGVSLNAMGQILPALVAIPSLGWIARNLSTDLFNFYLIILTLVGTLSVLDLGINRALVYEISSEIDDCKVHQRSLSAGIFISVFISLLLCVMLLLISPYLSAFLGFDDNIKEVRLGTIYTGLAIIPTMLIYCLMSYFEGTKSFAVFNFYRVLNGVFTMLIPLCLYMIFAQFASLLVGLLIAKISIFVVLLADLNKKNLIRFNFQSSVVIRMLHYGKWVFVTSVAGPLMVNLDKIIVARIVGIDAASAYIMSSELINRLSIFPQALGRYLFPSFVEDLSKSENLSLVASILPACIINFPIFLGIFWWGDDILSFWFGVNDTEKFELIVKILAVGFAFNALAQVPYASLHAKALTKVTAYIHLFELVFFFPILMYCLVKFGIIGASIVWTGRATIDCFLLFIADNYSRRFNSKRCES